MRTKNQPKRKNNLVTYIFIICLVVVGVWAVYLQVMKKQQLDTTSQTPTTETEKLIAKDLEVGYPETPKEVLKLWGRYNQCLYNATLSEEEFASLVKQLRVMYSDEINRQITEEKMVQNFKNEILLYQENDWKIVSYSLDTGTAIDYRTVNGKEQALVRFSYFMREGNNYMTRYHNFLLVKENEQWKVLGIQIDNTQKGKTQIKKSEEK